MTALGWEFRQGAIIALILAATALLPACGGHSGAPMDIDPLSADFTLVILDETYIEGGQAGEFRVTAAAEEGGVAVDILVTAAQDLKALICELSYDPERYDPVSVTQTGALDPEGDFIIEKTLALDVQPGHVYHGQVLPRPQDRDGLFGDAVLARALFLLQPDHAAKTASTPPLNDRSRAPMNWNAETDELDWYYFNSGDGNQDGEVGIPDLTSIGVYWKDATGGGPWPLSDIRSIVDYESNGEINSADMAPLARFFGVRVIGHNVYTSQDAGDYPDSNDGPNGPGAVLLGFREIYDSTGGGRLHYLFTVPEPQADYYYWVRPVDNEGTEGTPGGPE